MPSLSKILILIGVLLIIAGFVWWLAGDKLSWLGHLPGDIRVEKENFRFYFPITTMIKISVLLTVMVWVMRKLLQKIFRPSRNLRFSE